MNSKLITARLNFQPLPRTQPEPKLKIAPPKGDVVASVDLYEIGVALHNEGLNQFPYVRNEAPAELTRRKVRRFERAQFALYVGQRYQFGSFDAFMELEYGQRDAMLKSVDAQDLPDLAENVPFPLGDVNRTIQDACVYGRALAHFEDALKLGINKAGLGGIERVAVCEDMLLKPEVRCNIAPEGVLLTRPEEILLALLQETATPLSLRTVGDEAEVEEQTFAHGERSAGIPEDLAARLPDLRVDVVLTNTHGIEKHAAHTKNYGLTRKAGRERAREQAIRDTDRMLDAVRFHITRLGHRVEQRLHETVRVLKRPDLRFIPALVMKQSKVVASEIRPLEGMNPDSLKDWANQANHEAWVPLMTQYLELYKALEDCEKQRTLNGKVVLPKAILALGTVTMTDRVTDLDGAKTLIEQEGLSDDSMSELKRWVDGQERLSDRRVAYGSDPFVPDFIEVAREVTNRKPVEVQETALDFAAQGNYTVVLGTSAGEVPHEQRNRLVRKHRRSARPEGLVLAQDDVLCLTPEATFHLTAPIPQGFGQYIESAEDHLGTLTPLSLAHLLANASRVQLRIALPCTHKVQVGDQTVLVDQRHAALFREAFGHAHKNPVIEVVTL